MIVRSVVMLATVASLLPGSASAQTAPGLATALGVWRGTSTCTVKPSSCNDETVVYRITSGKGNDSLNLDARKIVNGREEEMGILGCRFAPPDQLSCAIARGVWHFTVRADSLAGELRLTDGTRFRDVRTIRSR